MTQHHPCPHLPLVLIHFGVRPLDKELPNTNLNFKAGWELLDDLGYTAILESVLESGI